MTRKSKESAERTSANNAQGASRWLGFAAMGTLAISALALSGCDKAPAPAGPPPAMPVGVIQVGTTDVALTNEWVGTLDGNVNAQIQPQVSGYLVKQNYREGLAVAKGQVLFEIDPRPLQAALDQSLAQLEQQKAAFGLTQTNVARDTPLAEVHAIATSQLDTDKSQMAQAEANVKAAQASVATARLNLGFTQVRSLIGGVAGQANTQVGNLVSQQTVLTSVSQLDPIRVYFSITDGEYLALTQRARSGKGSMLSTTGSIPLTLKLANGETYPQKGHIAFVDRQINAQTGAIRIAALFANPGNLLRPGQFGRVSAETEVRHNVVTVPQSVVQDLQGEKQIYTVGSDNKAHVVTVKLGPQSGNNWIVESGLPANATVIVDNLQKLRDGSPVNPHPAQIPAVAQDQTAGR